MPGLINELVSVLEEQAENYENLLALSHEKVDVIVHNDVKSLQRITSVENTIIGRNQKLEKIRIALNKDIANVLNKKEDELTISLLSELIKNQPEHPKLIDVSKRITKALTDLKDVNDRNRVLIENSIEFIDFNINLIRGSTASPPIYPNNKKYNNEDGTSLFDAKQ